MSGNFNPYCQRFFLILLCSFFLSPLYSQFNHRLLLRDEGLSKLSYVDIAHPERNWYVSVPTGRDMQLVGSGRVLIGTGTGYEERLITTGEKVYELTVFPGTVAARRLRNGNTLLTGLDWQGKKGIVLLEIDKTGTILRVINYPAYNYVRLVREKKSGTFLVAADSIVFEGDAKGAVAWQTQLFGSTKAHIWQALPLEDGKTIVSAGFNANFQIIAADGKVRQSFSAPPDTHPHFFAGFQILKNGNIVVTNWQGHGPDFGAIGVQLLELAPDGNLVWSWKQNPSNFSSLQGVIVLDDLNPDLLHVEDETGKLAPVIIEK